jgi:hypothetical protein
VQAQPQRRTVSVTALHLGLLDKFALVLVDERPDQTEYQFKVTVRKICTDSEKKKQMPLLNHNTPA